MVKRFVLRCLLLALPVVVATGAHVLWNKRYLPAPRITSNFALNEKLLMARNAMPEGVDILAIGSSMTLNNLHSAEVVEHFGTDRFLNLGAWGTGAGVLGMIGPMLVDRLHPRTVIISTNLMDFAGADMVASVDSNAILEFLDGNVPALDHLRFWNGPYYLRQIEANRVRLNDAGNYEYFVLDRFGGATLDVPQDRIDGVRFNKRPPADTAINANAYAGFEAFARLLHQRNIHLIVLQNAYRDGVRDADNDALQATHVARLRAFLEPMGHMLVDANTEQWPDDLYVDSSHLGPEGSRRFTAFCMERLAAQDSARAQ